MKRTVTYSYTFAPTASPPTLDLHLVTNFNFAKLDFVLDVTAGKIIYAAGAAGLGAAIGNSPYGGSNNLLALQAPLQGCAPGDVLKIGYDDGDVAAAAQLIQLVQSAAAVSSTNRLPVEIDAQSAGIAQDSSLAAINALLGTTGLTPPTLPSSSTGIMGYLRWLGTLITGTLSVVGSVAAGASATGIDPILAAGSDGSNIRTIRTDANGVQIIGSGASSSLAITTATTVKTSAGRIARVNVLVAGSGAGTVSDCASTGAIASGNEIAVIPNTVGVITLDWPCATGITISPGSGQTVSVSYT